MNTSNSPRRARLTREQIESAAREALAAPLGEERLRRVTDSSLEIDGALDDIPHDPLRLGRQFSDFVAILTRAYLAKFGDSPATRRRAMKDSLDHLTRRHGISQSKVRLHLNAYQKFQARPEALEFLRMTDMQLLVGKHISDEIIDAVIEMRTDDPTVSTRDVKAFVARLLRAGPGPAEHESGPDAPLP